MQLNAILVSKLYEKEVLQVCLSHLVKKLCPNEISHILRRVNPKWPPYEPHGTISRAVNIDFW